MISRQLMRRFVTSAARRGGDHHDEGGIPGGNLPFGIHNRFKLTVYFTLFFGSGLAVPYIILRHQLLKK